jgi:hypothetical protein
VPTGSFTETLGWAGWTPALLLGAALHRGHEATGEDQEVMSALWQSTVHICSPSQPPWLLWNLRPWLLASEQCGLGLVCDSPAPRPGCPFSIPLPFCGAGDSDRLLPPQTQCSLTTQPAGSGRQEEKRGHDCYRNCACVTTCLDRQSAHLTYGWTNICADPGSQTMHFPLCPAEDSGQEPLKSHQGRML